MARAITRWHDLAHAVVEGHTMSHDDALSVLSSSDDDLLVVLDAAFVVRRRFFGREVRIHVLQNAKSGVCPEDCGFCSQSLKASTGVERYRMQTVAELVEGARRAHAAGAVTYCMVTATRGPSGAELETVCEAVRQIKAELPLDICTSLGLLDDARAEALAEAGVDRFNHNLETSRRHFGDVVTTHSWQDRVDTVRAARRAGMQACCGGIVGLGETLEDRAALALELAALEVESVPINLLDPRPGTPMGHLPRLSPADALRALCMVRLCNPRADVRIAGGREVVLRTQQALALYPANSLFSQGYLTTGGQGTSADHDLIEAAGFVVAPNFTVEAVPA